LPPCGWGWPFPECGEGVAGATEKVMWVATMDALIQGIVIAVPTQIFVSFVLLFLTTGNWMVALLTTSAIVGIMASTFITFVAQAKSIGLYESLFLSITVAFGIDYVVHLAHAYNHSRQKDRCLRMQESLAGMGVSVVSGAMSTLLASSALFFCSLRFFTYYGSFIFFVVMWSILWALCFFPALMMTFGPNSPGANWQL
jgi:predicted RND superfamily exporter protein